MLCSVSDPRQPAISVSVWVYLAFLQCYCRFLQIILLVYVSRTWAQTIPGHVEFFSSEGSDTSIPIPIVALRNVDDSYPPQKKSFMMLKYMHDHYLDKYEWFMRADDDVYIKSEKLESFLRSLNSSEAIFLGQTGMGARDELGKLALEPGENFCMGGPGVIMSREVLKRMVPHIRECLQEMYTTHEDVEVGRCVRRFAGVQCVWSYEVRWLYFVFISCFCLSLTHTSRHRAQTDLRLVHRNIEKVLTCKLSTESFSNYVGGGVQET